MALETLGVSQHDVRICGDCLKLQGDCERIETKETSRRLEEMQRKPRLPITGVQLSVCLLQR